MTTSKRLRLLYSPGSVAHEAASELDSLTAERDRLKALLRRLEWIDTGISYRCCPICKCAVNFGHTPTCELAAAIKEDK